MRTSLAIFLTVAAMTLGAGAALANRPVAKLPDGTIVDLNTGVARAPDGHRYTLSPARLAAVREQVTGASAPGQHSGPTPVAKAVPHKPAPGHPPR